MTTVLETAANEAHHDLVEKKVDISDSNLIKSTDLMGAKNVFTITTL